MAVGLFGCCLRQGGASRSKGRVGVLRILPDGSRDDDANVDLGRMEVKGGRIKIMMQMEIKRKSYT